jgi:hypothetical protein
LTIMSIFFSHGGTANAWIVSIPSVGWCASAIFCSGDVNLWNARDIAVLGLGTELEDVSRLGLADLR